jgi:hypothetical protein
MKKEIVLFFLMLCGSINGYTEPSPTPVSSCVSQMTYPLITVYKEISSGMPFAIVKHFILTDPEMGSKGRWLLLVGANYLVFTNKNNMHLSESDFVKESLKLCSEPSDVQPYKRKEFDGGIKEL